MASAVQIDAEEYVKFDKVIFNWPKSLSYNTKTKPSDLQALKLHLDTRNWNLAADDKDEENEKKSSAARRGVIRDAIDCECLFLNKIRGSEYRNERNEAEANTEAEEEEGLELYIAHFEDMRMMLLFATRSVKQFAQRLFDLGKTSKVLAVPMETMSMEQARAVKRIERQVIKSKVQLKAIQLDVTKQNKRITHEENMSKWGKEYEAVRQVWQCSQDATFIGIDVETHEIGHHDMLEIGWSIVGPHRQQETFHYILEEAFTSGLRNGRYVADNRRNFQFGKALTNPLVGSLPPWTANGTEIATCEDTGRHFNKTMIESRRKGPVYVVFHDSKGDMQVMDEFGIDTRGWSYTMEEKASKASNKRPDQSNGDVSVSSLIDHKRLKLDPNEKLHPVYIIDTQLLFAAIRCNGNGEKKSLKTICIALDVNDGKLGYFHNAANDAHYTAAALAKMAEGPHVNEMRSIAEARLAQDQLQQQATKKAPKWAPRNAPTASWD